MSLRMNHIHIGCRDCNYWFHVDIDGDIMGFACHCGICGNPLEIMKGCNSHVN